MGEGAARRAGVLPDGPARPSPQGARGAGRRGRRAPRHPMAAQCDRCGRAHDQRLPLVAGRAPPAAARIGRIGQP